jgi:hypothetical protein
VVTAHVDLERRGPRCGGRWQPGPEVAGIVVGQRRFGVGLLSLIAVLREDQWYLAAVQGLALSVGASVDALHTMARRAAAMGASMEEQSRASPVRHGDETGGRPAGANG